MRSRGPKVSRILGMGEVSLTPEPRNGLGFRVGLKVLVRTQQAFMPSSRVLVIEWSSCFL